jgi:hypothetical protein
MRFRFRFLWAPETGAGGAAAGAGVDDGKSLLDDASGDASGGAPRAAVAPPTPAPAPDTARDDAGRGKPTRPDYLPEQFWDAEKGEPRLEAIAKSWKDSRDAINRGAKPPEKPEGYRLTLPEGAPAELVRADDPLLARVREQAHKAGISQAQFDAMAAPVVKAMAELHGRQPTREALERAEDERLRGEMAQLGATAETQISALATWTNGLLARGALSKEEHAALHRAATTAAGVRALAKLRTLSGEQAIPTPAPRCATTTPRWRARRRRRRRRKPAASWSRSTARGCYPRSRCRGWG